MAVLVLDVGRDFRPTFVSNSHPESGASKIGSRLSLMGPSSHSVERLYMGDKMYSCIVQLLYLADFLRHCSAAALKQSEKASVFYALKRGHGPRVCAVSVLVSTNVHMRSLRLCKMSR
jgi:hypothetical protein